MRESELPLRAQAAAAARHVRNASLAQADASAKVASRALRQRISSSTGGSTITYQLSLRIEYVKELAFFVATSHTYLRGVQMEYLK